MKGSYLGVGRSDVDNNGILLGDEADALVKWHFIRIFSPLHLSHRFGFVLSNIYCLCLMASVRASTGFTEPLLLRLTDVDATYEKPQQNLH